MTDSEPKRGPSGRLLFALGLALAAMLAWAAWQPERRSAARTSADEQPQAPPSPAALSSAQPSRPRTVGSALPTPTPTATGLTSRLPPPPERKLSMFGALRVGRQLLPERMRARIRGVAQANASNPTATSVPKSWSALEEDWQRESYDPKWSNDMKAQLTLATQKAEVDPKSIEQIDCRASACKVRFGFESLEAATRFQASSASFSGYEVRFVTPEPAKAGVATTGSPTQFEVMLDRDAF